MAIIDGKSLAASYAKNLSQTIKNLPTAPGLGMILVGDNPASHIYVNRKKKMCEQIGIYSIVHQMSKNATFDDVLSAIDALNKNNEIHGILLQLPTPPHINSFDLLNAISPSKDVDGLHPYNLGCLLSGKKTICPCTPQACLQLIKSVCPDVTGLQAVVLGRSVLVGQTAAILLTQAHATVTVLHSKSKHMEDICRNADILVSAIGKPHAVTKDFIKKGAIVIDVGINKIDDNIVGDIDFDHVKDIAGFITPVPGGVGPMTVFNLMLNTVIAYGLQNNIPNIDLLSIIK